MIEVPFVFAFSAGLVAAFNPCGAAMFPAYVGYQLNSSSAGGNILSSTVRAITMGILVTAGFVLVFGTVGILIATVGHLIGRLLPFFGLGIGVVITAVGLVLLCSKRRVGIISATRMNLGSGRGFTHTFLFGIAYAVASLSCALPIFLAAVGVIAGESLTAGSAIKTIVGSAAYGLGMGAIMLSATLGVVFFKDLVRRWIRAVLPFVEPVGNMAMVIAGGYLVHYWTLGKGQELLLLRIDQLF